MTSRDFCFFLQGLFELSEPADDVFVVDGQTIRKGLSPRQTELIKQHLALVFKHEMGEKECGHDPLPEEPNIRSVSSKETPWLTAERLLPPMPWKTPYEPPASLPKYPFTPWDKFIPYEPFGSTLIC